MKINSLSSIMPPFLSNKDKIEIVVSAKFVIKKDIVSAVNIIKSYGFDVSFNQQIFNKKDVFAGTKQDRIKNIQRVLDDDETKAVFFARGGYGSIQIIDKINFDSFKKRPKWLVGFSDITIFLMHIYENYRINSIHGPMPYNFKSTKQSDLIVLFDALRGKFSNIQFNYHKFNNLGQSSGVAIGGNLSILCSLIGSNSFSKLNQDSILFIEDVDEYLYRTERMIYMLDRAGVFKKIKGLIIGSITKSLDNQLPFGQTAYQIIHSVVSKYNYPIAFDFPVGHGINNRPIILGARIQLNVSINFSKMEYKLNG